MGMPLDGENGGKVDAEGGGGWIGGAKRVGEGGEGTKVVLYSWVGSKELLIWFDFYNLRGEEEALKQIPRSS